MHESTHTSASNPDYSQTYDQSQSYTVTLGAPRPTDTDTDAEPYATYTTSWHAHEATNDNGCLSTSDLLSYEVTGVQFGGQFGETGPYIRIQVGTQNVPPGDYQVSGGGAAGNQSFETDYNRPGESRMPGRHTTGFRYVCVGLRLSNFQFLPIPIILSRTYLRRSATPSTHDLGT